MPLTSTNLKYKGAFRVPNTSHGTNLTLAYGGTALAFNPANNSLFIVGHDHTQCLAEISIPVPKTSSYNRATFLQTPRNPSIPSNGLNGNIKIGGLYVYNGSLYGTKYIFYDGDNFASTSHFKFPGVSLTQAAQGMYKVEAPNPAWVAGYMGSIPVEHQAKFGGKKHFTGLGILSIISRASSGPAAFALNLEDIGAALTDTIPMVGYPLSNPLNNPDVANTLYTRADQVRGAVFPNGSDTMLFFGSHGTGTPCYGDGGPCGDQSDSNKGEHAYPYQAQVWAYNVNDLADVAAGRKQNYQIKPTVWKLAEMGAPRYAGGAAYDPATNRIYIVQMHGEQTAFDPFPLIHVYEVDTGVTNPPADITPPTITNVQSTNITPTSATITWVTSEQADAQIEYGLTSSYGTTTQVYPAMTINHAVNLTNLPTNSTIFFRIKSKDAAGNLTTSAGGQFKTLAPPDVTPPSFGVSVINIGETTARLNAGPLSEPASMTAFINNTSISDSMDVAAGNSIMWDLTSLVPDTVYAYSVVGRDFAGNSITMTGAFKTLPVPIDPCQVYKDQVAELQTNYSLLQFQYQGLLETNNDLIASNNGLQNQVSQATSENAVLLDRLANLKASLKTLGDSI